MYDWVYFEYVVFTSITPSLYFLCTAHMYCNTLTALVHYSILCTLYSQWVERPSRARSNQSVQLNRYEADPYFFQIFQSNTSVCLIISMFCESCKPICKPEIVLKNIAVDFQANPTDISCKFFEQFQVHTTWVHNSYKTRK